MDNKQYVERLLVAIQVDATGIITGIETAIKKSKAKLETLPKEGSKIGEELGISISDGSKQSIEKGNIGKSLIDSFKLAIANIKQIISKEPSIKVKAKVSLDTKEIENKGKVRIRNVYKLGEEYTGEEELGYKKTGTLMRLNKIKKSISTPDTSFTKSGVKDSNLPKKDLIQELGNSFVTLKKNSENVINTFRNFAVGKVGIEEVFSSVTKLISGLTPLQVSFAAVGAVIVSQMKLVGEAISQVWALMDPKMLQDVGVKTASQFEQFETKFEIFLGSSDAAKSRIAEYAEFGAETPFNLPEIVEAGKLLQQFGGDALATGDNLKMVGDMAASSGRSFNEIGMWVARAYSSMKSGRPFGEAAMRLQELGLLSGEARNKLESLQKSGASFDKQWGAFTQVMGQFSGMMEKQSHTMEGLTSNIEDFGQQMALVGGKPLFDQKKAGLEVWYNWLTKNDSVLKQLALAVGGIKSAWNDFSKGFKKQVLDNLDLDSLLSGFNRIWESLAILSASTTADDFDIARIITDSINALIDLFDEISIKILEMSITWSQFNAFVQAGQTAITGYWLSFNIALDSMTGKVNTFGLAVKEAFKLTPMGMGDLANDIAQGKGVLGIGKSKEEIEREKEDENRITNIKKSMAELETILGKDYPLGFTFDTKQEFETAINNLVTYGALSEEQAKRYKNMTYEGKEYKKALYELQRDTILITSSGEDMNESLKKSEAITKNLASLNLLEYSKSVDEARANLKALQDALTNPPEKKKYNTDPDIELRKQQAETINQQIQLYSEEMITIKQDKAKKEEALLTDHNKNLADIQKDGAKEQQDIEEDNLEKQEEMAEDYYKKQQDIVKDTDEKLQKIREKGDLEEKRQSQNHSREMKKLDETYMYDLTEAVKNRDAQAIVDLRRKHDIEKTEKQDNYEFEKQRRAEDRSIEEQEVQADYQKRMETLDLEMQERATKLEEEKQKELISLQEKLDEQTLKENEAYKEQQQQLDDALKTKLESIATELAKVPGMTEEMVRTIVGGIDQIFGIGGNVEKIVSEAMDRIKTKMHFDLKIQAKVIAVSEDYNRSGPGRMYNPNNPNASDVDEGGSPTIGGIPENAMATGGVRLTNKPTLLMVGEAGPELFSAAPLSSLTTLKNLNKEGGGKGIGGKLQIEFMGSAPPGLGIVERDQIASVLLNAIRETGILQ